MTKKKETFVLRNQNQNWFLCHFSASLLPTVPCPISHSIFYFPPSLSHQLLSSLPPHLLTHSLFTSLLLCAHQAAHRTSKDLLEFNRGQKSEGWRDACLIPGALWRFLSDPHCSNECKHSAQTSLHIRPSSRLSIRSTFERNGITYDTYGSSTFHFSLLIWVQHLSLHRPLTHSLKFSFHFSVFFGRDVLVLFLLHVGFTMRLLHCGLYSQRDLESLCESASSISNEGFHVQLCCSFVF